jgi:hypothetical protein
VGEKLEREKRRKTMAHVARKMARKSGVDIDKVVDLLVKIAVHRKVFLKHAVADFKRAYMEKARHLKIKAT